jgi:hypothetical protein
MAIISAWSRFESRDLGAKSGSITYAGREVEAGLDGAPTGEWDYTPKNLNDTFGTQRPGRRYDNLPQPYYDFVLPLPYDIPYMPGYARDWLFDTNWNQDAFYKGFRTKKGST